MKVGIFGPGKTFGDIDAHRKRGYMYSVRAVSSDVVLYEVSASDFIVHIKSIGKEKRFKAW